MPGSAGIAQRVPPERNMCSRFVKIAETRMSIVGGDVNFAMMIIFGVDRRRGIPPIGVGMEIAKGWQRNIDAIVSFIYRCYR
jgi:hypothetical protein